MGIGLLIGAVVVYEGCVQAKERIERRRLYAEAAADARARNLPLVVVGCPRWYLFHHGTGDLCIDIMHRPECRCENPVTMDARDIDHHLKAKSCVIFTSHFLEHLSAEESRATFEAIRRVAVADYHAFPSKLSIMGQMAPEHKCWPVVKAGNLVFEPRPSRCR